MWGKDREIDVLMGMTMESVKQEGNEAIRFKSDCGREFVMHHHQDCCECVTIEDINGDLGDLVGREIVMAEAVSSDKNPDDADPETISYQDSFTWTFYKLATTKGSVTIRWYGSSNGYYSERVDFEEV